MSFGKKKQHTLCRRLFKYTLVISVINDTPLIEVGRKQKVKQENISKVQGIFLSSKYPLPTIHIKLAQLH